MVGEISERIAMARTRSVPQDLKPRAVSGVVLAVIGLAASYAGPPFFSALALVIAAVMSWEWGRIVRDTNQDAALWVHLASMLIAGLAAAMGAPGIGLIAVCAGAVAVFSVATGARRLLSAFGVVYVGVPAIALIWL